MKKTRKMCLCLKSVERRNEWTNQERLLAYTSTVVQQAQSSHQTCKALREDRPGSKSHKATKAIDRAFALVFDFDGLLPAALFFTASKSYQL